MDPGKECLNVDLKLGACLLIDGIVDQEKVNHLPLRVDPVDSWTSLLVLLYGLPSFGLGRQPVTLGNHSLGRVYRLHILEQVVQEGVLLAEVRSFLDCFQPLLQVLKFVRESRLFGLSGHDWLPSSRLPRCNDWLRRSYNRFPCN